MHDPLSNIPADRRFSRFKCKTWKNKTLYGNFVYVRDLLLVLVKGFILKKGKKERKSNKRMHVVSKTETINFYLLVTYIMSQISLVLMNVS